LFVAQEHLLSRRLCSRDATPKCKKKKQIKIRVEKNPLNEGQEKGETSLSNKATAARVRSYSSI
jgi:hypothetical protein